MEKTHKIFLTRKYKGVLIQMNTVQKNNNITKKMVQELLEKNQEKLRINDKDLKKIIKSIKCRYTHGISKEMRGIFYQEVLKRIENKKEEASSKYYRITEEDRISIEVLYTAGFGYSFIGTFIGKNRSSIQREIEKNAVEYWDVTSTKSPYRDSGQQNIKYYSAKKAQKQAEKNKSKNRKKCKLDKYPNLRWSVVALLKEKKLDYSPDIISNLSKEGRIKYAEDSIGTTAIYKAVKDRKYGLNINDLPHKRGYNKPQKDDCNQQKEVSKSKKDISIEVMPEKIKNKEVDTHFEGDSIIGKAAGSNNTLITLVNVASQFTFIRRSKNKKAQSTVDVINKLEADIPELNRIMESLLLDNGVEFSRFDDLMKSIKEEVNKRFQIYFAHPYSSYERGSNENKNRLIRRHLKKGRLVERLSDKDILNIEKRINNMPRKALGYRTPLEVFEGNIKKKGLDTSFLDVYRIELPKVLVA